MRSRSYDASIVTARPPRRVVETVAAEPGLVVEEVSTGWCGAVVECDKERVSLEDRHGKVRVFPLEPGALRDAVFDVVQRLVAHRRGDRVDHARAVVGMDHVGEARQLGARARQLGVDPEQAPRAFRPQEVSNG